MDEKLSETVSSICTMLGAALLLYPIIDQATKSIIPEMQKLTSGEIAQEIKALPIAQDDQKPDKEEPEKQEHKTYTSEC